MKETTTVTVPMPTTEGASALLQGAGAAHPSQGFEARFAKTCELVSAMVKDRGGRGEMLTADLALRRAEGNGRIPERRCRMVRTADDWLALNLARPEDLELLPAWVASESNGVAVEEAVELARDFTTAALLERGRLLGLPIAGLGLLPDRHLVSRGQRLCEVPFLASVPKPPPGVVVRDSSATVRVLDLSAMWAGPLCANVLARAGCEVTRVESPVRRDGFHRGDPVFYEYLNQAKSLLLIDPSTPIGRSEMVDVIEHADVVISSSRPRVFDQWGIDVARVIERGGIWTAITGYGWRGDDPNRVAFGDDAAVAGGFYRRPDAGGRPPEFIGDATADPVAGMTAAWATLSALQHGDAVFIDLAMREAMQWHCRVSGYGTAA